jgi:GT2 family glycosyltransferase
VTYNSSAVIAQCLDGLAPAQADGLVKVVVVDNASKDRTPEQIRSKYPWVRVVDSGGNLGFGRGCNLGLSDADTPYGLLLNPDALLPKEALERLVAFMDAHPKAMAAAPATWVYGDSQLQNAGGLPTPVEILKVAAGLATHVRGTSPIRPGQPPFRTDWLGGGIMLLRMEHFRKLGGFDPAFFLYFEETDLCRRAVDAGYELWAVGEAVARHIGGTAAKASGEPLIYGASLADPFFRSRFYYLAKHFGWPRAAFTEVAEIALLAGKSAAKKLTGRDPGSALTERLGGPIMRKPIFPS